MDIIEIITALADSSIALVLALVVIYWNRNDMKEYANREREDKVLLMNALQENTQVLSELKTLVQRLNGKH
jgi:CHASE3 domain sensor protein